MAEDPEEKKSFVSDPEVRRLPLTFCAAKFRTSESPLTLVSFIKSAVTILLVESVCLLGIGGARSNWSWLSWLCIGQLFVKAFLYIFMYANLLSGGWGSSEKRFWCDVNIMYVRGFNTIRNIMDIFSFIFYIWIIAIVLDVNSPIFMAVVPLLAMISEWQSALSENRNQDGVAVIDKYISNDNRLCLESFNYYQYQKKEGRIADTPFIVHCIIKTYIITCLLTVQSWDISVITFGGPIVAAIVCYVYILTLTIDFMYIRHFKTFCQIEMYRMIFDCVFPVTIAAFSLV